MKMVAIVAIRPNLTLSSPPLPSPPFSYNTGLNLAEASNFANKEWWVGGHFHDAIAVGHCTCKDFRRFHFDDDDVREGLIKCGEPFGIAPSDL